MFLSRVANLKSGAVHVAVVQGPEIGIIEGVAEMSELLAMTLSDIKVHAERGANSLESATGYRLLAPVDGDTEIWAAGVTYERSREARVEESETQDVYTKVYDADRPELFFKSVAWKVVTDGDPIGRRSDSTNDTAEPELGLAINRHGEIIGYLVSNDMSSRSIEGDNPLYLPQAKTYAGSCGLCPRIRPVWEVTDPYDLTMTMTVIRDGDAIFEATASTGQLKRTFAELVSYLFAGQVFPSGVILSTGTSIVPPLDLPTLDGDIVNIAIPEVGLLTNYVTDADTLTDWLAARRTDPLAQFG